MLQENQQNLKPDNLADENEINLLELLIILAKRKKEIFGITGIAAIGSVAVSLSMTPIYTANTSILTPQQSQSAASAMLGQLGALGGMAGASLGIKNPADLYIRMLKSRTVQDAMIQRFDLKTSYEKKDSEATRNTLSSRTKASAGKDGIITIEVDDESPKRAAEMANAYVHELYNLTQVLAVTDASQRRLFYERQLQQTRDKLAEAETGLKSALDSGGIVKVDEQGKAMLDTVARLRGQIAAKEVQIGAMQSFAAANNPDLKLAQQEVESMRKELAKIEGGRGNEPISVNQPGFDNIKRLREVKYYETMYELLAKQYELARIEEAKEASLIQVLDKAIEPEHKSKPKRAVIVLFSTLFALFIGIFWAFVREAGERVSQNPEKARQWNSLKGYLRLRS